MPVPFPLSGNARREADPEDRPATLAALHGERAAMLRHDRVADRKAEPRRFLGGVERLEDAPALLRGHAGTSVGDLGHHPLTVAARRDPDLAALRLRLAGVEDQVQEHLAQKRLAPLYTERRRREVLLEADRAELRARADELDRLPQDGVEVEDGAGGARRVGL